MYTLQLFDIHPVSDLLIARKWTRGYRPDLYELVVVSLIPGK